MYYFDIETDTGENISTFACYYKIFYCVLAYILWFPMEGRTPVLMVGGGDVG